MRSCPRCAAGSLVSVTMTLSGGPVQFFHCRACEHRWWLDTEAGACITLPAVLEKVSV